MSDTFTTIAVFQYAAEAQVIKQKLISEGISVFLADEHTINTDPLVSNAIGGVKLQVPTNKVLLARKVVKEISPELIVTKICCLYCEASNIRLKITLKNIFLKLIPVSGIFTYMCLECKQSFKEVELL